MADKKPEKPAAAAAEPAPAAEPARKGKLPFKTIAVVAGLMIAEAAGVVVVLGMTSPSKSQAATDKHSLVTDEAEQTKEIQIVEDKFQNLQTGKVWLWDAAVYVQVKNKNADVVSKTLERRSNEIKEGVAQIFSRAQHAQLKEPERQTLNRQLTTFFADIFKTADNHPLVERVLIPRCRGFPADA